MAEPDSLESVSLSWSSSSSIQFKLFCHMVRLPERLIFLSLFKSSSVYKTWGMVWICCKIHGISWETKRCLYLNFKWCETNGVLICISNGVSWGMKWCLYLNLKGALIWISNDVLWKTNLKEQMVIHGEQNGAFIWIWKEQNGTFIWNWKEQNGAFIWISNDVPWGMKCLHKKSPIGGVLSLKKTTYYPEQVMLKNIHCTCRAVLVYFANFEIAAINWKPHPRT